MTQSVIDDNKDQKHSQLIPDAPTTTANGISDSTDIAAAQLPQLPTPGSPEAATDFGAGDTMLAAIGEQGERSPGPLLEEMANGLDDESGLIRMNGFHNDLVGFDDSGIGMGSPEDSQSGEQGFSDPSSERMVEERSPIDLRRVKVYELIGSVWTDRGTAICQGEFDNEADEARLVATDEHTNEVLLNCLIRGSDVYQRQQETLIVWTEPDGTDFALSFQDAEGCAEVWDFIVEVQKHLNSRDPRDLSELPPSNGPTSAAQIIQSGHLPPPGPNASLICEIEKAIRSMARTPKSRETICTYMQDKEYVHQMIETFERSEREEDQENIDVLHALCSCMQTILLLNEHQMYEHILTDELWMGVIGILEYDPEFPKHKANYREFLVQRSRFLQPVTIEDPKMLQKIHHTYRLQYLKDVILGRALDDSTFNVLNSCIIFNQMEIIGHVQQDERFLTDLVSLFIKPDDKDRDKKEVVKGASQETAKPSGSEGEVPAAGESSQSVGDPSMDTDSRKKEVISLLQQLCIMGKNVQLPARISLFRTLVERGALYPVQWALTRSDKHLIYTAGEILAVFIDHAVSSIRVHILHQASALGQAAGDNSSLSSTPAAQSTLPGNDVLRFPQQERFKDIAAGGQPPFKETIAQVLSRMLANSYDLALQNQISDAIRILGDAPTGDTLPEQLLAMSPKLLGRPLRDDQTTNSYLDNFYKVCVETLFQPLIQDIPVHQELKDKPFAPSRERGNLYLYLCDLLCSFATQHSYRIHFFVLSSNIFPHVASLLSVKEKHLSLAALRFFRVCSKTNNFNIFKSMDKHECFSAIVRLAMREARRENLLSCACQEFFEFLRKATTQENVKDAINFIMNRHESDLRELAKTAYGAQTYQGFVSRWEINKEPPPPEEKRPSILTPRLFGQRPIESDDEDAYFNGDDNSDDPVLPVQRVDTFLSRFRMKRQRISTPGPMAQSQKGTTRAVAGRGAGSATQQQQQQRPTTPLSSLLEYEDEEEGALVISTGAGASDDEDGGAPRSPVLPHRQIQILPYDPSTEPPDRSAGAGAQEGVGAGEPASPSSSGASSDPEDDLLEALVPKSVAARAQAQQSEKRRAFAPSPELPRLREKRRRGGEDEDEDDMLERLAPKNRRVGVPVAGQEPAAGAGAKGRTASGGGGGANANATANATSVTKAGAEGGDTPRRFRLKLGGAGAKVLGADKPVVVSKADSKGGGNG